MRCRWSLLLGHCSFSSISLGTTFLIFCLIKCSGLSHSIACNHSFTCWCITLPWETLYVPMTNNYGNTEFSGATNGIPTEIREYAAAKIRPPRCLYCPQSWVVMMDKSLFFRDLCIFCRDAYTPSCGNYKKLLLHQARDHTSQVCCSFRVHFSLWSVDRPMDLFTVQYACKI